MVVQRKRTHLPFAATQPDSHLCQTGKEFKNEFDANAFEFQSDETAKLMHELSIALASADWSLAWAGFSMGGRSSSRRNQ